MEFLVADITRVAGSFIDPKTHKEVEYDNTYLYLKAYDEQGNPKKPILPKIKTANVPHDLCEGDFVKVYYNEFKQPEAVYISRKGDNK